MRRGARLAGVTLFLYLGEDGAGAARYRAVRMDAFVFMRRGMRQDLQRGQRGDDRAEVYLFDVEGPRGRYVPPGAYAGAPGQWTVRGDGRDRLYLGSCYSDVPPEGDGRLLRPVSVRENLHGRPRVRHVRVVCA